MGCCFSRATPKNPNPQPHLKSSQPKSIPNHHGQTPPPPPEEESVKEVLSETPISSKPNQVPIFIPETNTQIPLLQNPYENFENKGHKHQVPILLQETKTQMPLVQNPSEKFETKGPNPIEEVTEAVSQLSEATTVTESFSTATTATTATVTEKREDEATSKQCSRGESTTATMNQKWSRSPSRKRPLVADGNVAGGGGSERRVKSPARRAEPSPEKKMKSGSRLVRGRESGPVTNRKINAGSAGVRRDSGEGSGRRSRSPSCSRTVGGSSKVGIGGGRKQAPAPAAVENGTEKKSESEEVEEKNDIVSQGESIENPHVSMECFIFL